MSYINQDRHHAHSDEHLHLDDLPRWPVWAWLVAGCALAVGLLLVIDEVMDANSRAIAASALVRGVPPPAIPSNPTPQAEPGLNPG